MTPLEVRISALGRHTLVTLEGEVDVTNSASLADRLAALLAQAAPLNGANGGTPHAAVIVNLPDLTWCDTTGLGTFVMTARRARETGVSFVVTGARGRVARILHLTGLEKAPWVRPELADAVRDVHESSGTAPSS